MKIVTRSKSRTSEFRPTASLGIGENMEEAGGGGQIGSAVPAGVVARLSAAKRASGKSYGQIAAETGLTNVYMAQLLQRQAQLKSDTTEALRVAIHALTDDLLSEMMAPPFRSYHSNLIQEPAIYR